MNTKSEKGPRFDEKALLNYRIFDAQEEPETGIIWLEGQQEAPHPQASENEMSGAD